MLALSNHFRLGCFDPHLTLFASCYFGGKVHHHQSRVSRSQLLEKICAAVAIYHRLWWESGSNFLDSTHSTRIISGGRLVRNWSSLFYQILQIGLQNSFTTSGRRQLEFLILLNLQVLWYAGQVLLASDHRAYITYLRDDGSSLTERPLKRYKADTTGDPAG